MLKTRVRASLERPGPHRGELHECSTPTECRMHMGHAGHTQPNRAQTPEIPNRNHGRGEDQPDGGFPENQGTSGNPGSAAATFFKQWPTRPVLGAAKPPVRGNRQSWRVETGGRPKRTKNPKEGNTPTPPPTQDGARGTQVPVGSEYTTPPPKE